MDETQNKTMNLSFYFKKYFCFEAESKKRNIFLTIILLAIVVSTFLTVLFQSPRFIDSGVNNLALLMWPLIVLTLIIFDYKAFLSALIKVSIPLVIFAAYLILALLFGVNAFTGELTKLIGISAVLFVIGNVLSFYFNKRNIKAIMVSYIVASILLGILIYFSSLRGADIHDLIYAYGSKNSSGPILFIATIFVFFIGTSKKSPLRTLFRLLIVAFFVVLIAIMKCRTVLITMPVVFFILFFKQKPSTASVIVVFFILFASLVICFCVPQIRTTLISDILFIGKEDQGIDAVSSGRFTVIIDAFSKWQPIFGNGNTYVDCLPVQYLCTFGIVGTVCLLPYTILPIYVLRRYKKYCGKTDYFYLLLLLIIVFLINGIFEGHGQFGPGAKTFVFWVLCGFIHSNFQDDRVDVSINKTIKSVRANTFVAVFCSVIYAVSVALMLIPSGYSNMSNIIYEKIDSNVEFSSYTPIDKLEIQGPKTICVGQTIGYSALINPSSATDKQVFWESWGESYLSVDRESGAVTGKQAGRVTLKAYCYDYNIEDREVISIVNQQEFDFGSEGLNFSITFDNGQNSSIIKKGQKALIKYDEHLFPCKQFIEFVSSDPNVANIDNDGIITGNHAGNCSVIAKINNKYPCYSNEINITVKDEFVSPIDTINVSIPETIYQNIDYSFKPEFYSHNVKIENVLYEVELDKGQFVHKEGKIRLFGPVLPNAIKVIPIYSNNDNQITRNIDVKTNNPTKLIINCPEWIKLSDVFKVDVDILYSNGDLRRAELEEVTATSLRASNKKCGVVNDSLHYAAIKSGSASVTLQLKNSSISKRKTFNVYKYDKETFLTNSKNVSFCFLPLISLFACSCSLLLSFRKPKEKIIFAFLFLIICFIPLLGTVFLNHITPPFYAYLTISLSVLIYMFILALQLKFRYNGLYESALSFATKTDYELYLCFEI